jgi:hypothetical protein
MIINNNITEAYCSFEVSKLLKEKGFDIPCFYYTGKHKGVVGWKDVENIDTTSDIYENFLSKNSEIEEYCSSIPTHALAIEWIRVNFGTQFHLIPHWINGICYYRIGCTFINFKNEVDMWSPQEATEAALLHTLQNLI